LLVYRVLFTELGVVSQIRLWPVWCVAPPPNSLSSLEDSANLTLTVANTGHRDGAEVVQLYLRPVNMPSGALIQPRRQLVDFARVALPVNSPEAAVTFVLKGSQLGLVSSEGTLALCPGTAVLEATTGVKGSKPVEVQLLVDTKRPLVIEEI